MPIRTRGATPNRSAKNCSTSADNPATSHSRRQMHSHFHTYLYTSIHLSIYLSFHVKKERTHTIADTARLATIAQKDTRCAPGRFLLISLKFIKLLKNI